MSIDLPSFEKTVTIVVTYDHRTDMVNVDNGYVGRLVALAILQQAVNDMEYEEVGAE